jgi:hypothetical protein
VDVRVAQAPTLESETVESLPEEGGQVEEDFTSRSG